MAINAKELVQDYGEIIGAFFGAFFAFLFYIVTSINRRIYNRQKIHYTSLVKIEHQLIENINIIKDNIYILPGYRKAANEGNIYWSILRPLQIDRSVYLELADINLLNTIFSVHIRIRKINDDIENLGLAYNEVKNAFITKNITLQEYKLNADRIASFFDLINKELEKIDIELQGILKDVGFKLKIKPFLLKTIDYIYKKLQIDKNTNKDK